MTMRTADPTALVIAAQAGDSAARDELIAGHLQLLYSIVGRALHGHDDVDDVVQDTLLRVVRDLSALRSPDSFRSWLVAIALRQISTHNQRRRVIADRMTVLDRAYGLADGAEDLEETAIQRAHVSHQRRRVVEASRWLEPGNRALLSLWWQENAGRLSRSEVAAAARTSVAHVGVRLQRMREQLELGRAIVAALTADPRCPGLTAAIAGWDGRRTPLWRKRIARHTRDCPACVAQTVGQVPTERLLLAGELPPAPSPTALIDGNLSGHCRLTEFRARPPSAQHRVDLLGLARQRATDESAAAKSLTADQVLESARTGAKMLTLT